MIITVKQFPDCTGQVFAAFIPVAIPEKAGYYRLEDNHVLSISEGKTVDLCLPYHPTNECFHYTHPNAKIQEIAAGRLMVFRLPRTHVFLHRFKWHGFPYLHIPGRDKFQACIMHHVEKAEGGDEFFVNFIHNRILVQPNFFTLDELQHQVAPTSIPQP